VVAPTSRCIVGVSVIAPLEEMTAWSIDEIVAAIYTLVPREWYFDRWDDDHGLHARVVANETGEVMWDDTHADERLLLFNAYGWLWARNQPKLAPDDPWNRRRELTSAAVSRMAMRIPDPEDLQPDEIRSVYEQHRKPRRN